MKEFLESLEIDDLPNYIDLIYLHKISEQGFDLAKNQFLPKEKKEFLNKFSTFKEFNILS